MYSLSKTEIRCSPFTDLHLEVVEGMLVDVLHLLPQSHGVVCQGQDVGAAFLVIGGVIEARGGHVGGADGLDLLQLSEPLFTDDLGGEEQHRAMVTSCCFSHLATDASISCK